jgi:hypothetical protein
MWSVVVDNQHAEGVTRFGDSFRFFGDAHAMILEQFS